MLRSRDGVGEVRSLLDDYLALLQRRVPLEAFAVFGSRSRGEHRRTSDIDVVAVSPAFARLSPLVRIGVLLEDWPGSPALEPLGYTREELVLLDHLVLVDAVHDGVPLLDRGPWREARRLLEEHVRNGRLRRRPGGWTVRWEVPGGPGIEAPEKDPQPALLRRPPL